MASTTIAAHSGVIVASNDVQGGGVSLVALNTEVQAIVQLLKAVVNYEPVSQTEAQILKKLLQTVVLDGNGKIVANQSLAPMSINNTEMSASAVSAENHQAGGVTTIAILPNAVTATYLQEVTTPQSITTTLGSGTTPPVESTWTENQVANVALTPYTIADEILLNCFVQITVSNFYVTASQHALTNAGPTTQVYDLLNIRFRDTISNTIIKEFPINIQVGDLINNSAQEVGQWAVSLSGTSFAYTIEHIFSGFSDLNIVAEFAAVDMIQQYAGGQALVVTITDILLSLTDIAR